MKPPIDTSLNHLLDYLQNPANTEGPAKPADEFVEAVMRYELIRPRTPGKHNPAQCDEIRYPGHPEDEKP